MRRLRRLGNALGKLLGQAVPKIRLTLLIIFGGALLLGAVIAADLAVSQFSQWQARRIDTADLRDPAQQQDPDEQQRLFVRQKRIDIENANRENLIKIIQSLGGLAFVFTAYFAWRNLQVAEKNREIAERNWVLAEDKQVAERFTRAVEMLGDQERIEVRLGGIYSLERIAKDAPENYHWIVMEVLTAFVRENSPVIKPQDQTNSDESRKNLDNLLPLPVIKAIFTVIRRRENVELEPESLDFEDAVLHGANLRGVNLRGANLYGANLNLVKLSKADLTGSHLNEAILHLANLTGADLTGADLRNANLCKANLMDVDLKYANLCEADLTGADLVRANFRGTENLTPEQVKAAKNWEQAIYDDDFRQQLGLEAREPGRTDT